MRKFFLSFLPRFICHMPENWSWTFLSSHSFTAPLRIVNYSPFTFFLLVPPFSLLPPALGRIRTFSNRQFSPLPSEEGAHEDGSLPSFPPPASHPHPLGPAGHRPFPTFDPSRFPPASFTERFLLFCSIIAIGHHPGLSSPSSPRLNISLLSLLLRESTVFAVVSLIC